METFLLLWNFAPDMKVKLLALSLVGLMLLALSVYGAMSRARLAAGRANRITADTYKATNEEPEDLRVFTRAVANQFEMPIMFYALVVAHLALGTASWITVALAWAFVIARTVHIREMISENRVMKRRKFFIRAMQIFIVMLVEFTLAVIFLAQA